MRNKKFTRLTAYASAIAIFMVGIGAAAAETPLDRTQLPIQEPKRPLYKELDARNAKMPPHFEVKAPAGAPNVVIILIDDLGFGATGTFGGPIPTPTLDDPGAGTDCATTTSTPRRSARRRARRSSPAATTTP